MKLTSVRLLILAASTLLLLFFVPWVASALEVITPNPTPPGYVQGGGPSGFDLRYLPEAPPLRAAGQPPIVAPPLKPLATTPDGDLPGPGTPILEGLAPAVQYQIQGDGSIVQEAWTAPQFTRIHK